MTNIEDTSIIRINTDPWQNEKGTIVEKVQIETFALVSDQHPALKLKLPKFDFANATVDPNKFASSLVETCKKLNAFGLSANQCGFEHRVFVMGSGEQYVSFFNPEIIWVSEEKSKMEEGCVTFLDLFLKIERPTSIKVRYQDFNGTVRETMFAGLTARCFQHELDHLNGIVYTQHVQSLALRMAKQKRLKLTEQRRKLKKLLTDKVKNVSKQLAR